MESMSQSVMYYNSYKLKLIPVIYIYIYIYIYILIMSHNGMASVKYV